MAYQLTNTVISPTSTSSTTNDNMSLKKALKAYKDKYYTGISDEDKAEINAKVKEYLANHEGYATQKEMELFIKGLMEEYGFKGFADADTGKLQSITRIIKDIDGHEYLAVENRNGFRMEIRINDSFKDKSGIDNKTNKLNAANKQLLTSVNTMKVAAVYNNNIAAFSDTIYTEE